MEAEKQEILRRYRGLLRAAKNSKKRAERKAIRKAFDVALEAHKDIRRKSGEPYIYHPIAVARVVAEEMGLGTTSIVCALLHDTVEVVLARSVIHLGNVLSLLILVNCILRNLPGEE